jgi:hypothetical protein
MSERKLKKLYSNNPDVKFTTTKIDPLRTQAEINGLLARWGITKYGWEWDLENNKCRLQFQFNEKFQDQIEVSPVVVLEPPRIWDKKNKNRPEDRINWSVSMRILKWWLENQLEMSFCMQHQKVVAFLPHIVNQDFEPLKDFIIPNLNRLEQFKALPEVITQKKENERVIEA